VNFDGGDFKGWHSRGYLPHFDSQDIPQCVTFRLADSLPMSALERLYAATRAESLRDEMLDRGWGACWLRRDEIARIVQDAFLLFDGARYRLHAWTIMPNHVHVLFSQISGNPLGAVIASWKRFTAAQANQRLGRSGPFWQKDYWDRFIRDDDHFAAAEHYIDMNPVKAGLIGLAHDWPWGSARLKYDARSESRAPSS
jgi:REP element-mobilizing transposase RayT